MMINCHYEQTPPRMTGPWKFLYKNDKMSSDTPTCYLISCTGDGCREELSLLLDAPEAAVHGLLGGRRGHNGEHTASGRFFIFSPPPPAAHYGRFFFYAKGVPVP
jgi:hypothetical protein